MEHEEAALLLGAYAVHALDDDEDVLVLAHLDGCARCRSEVTRYQQVLRLLGGAGETDDVA